MSWLFMALLPHTCINRVSRAFTSVTEQHVISPDILLISLLRQTPQTGGHLTAVGLHNSSTSMMDSMSTLCLVLCCLLVGIEGTNLVVKFHQNNSIHPEKEPKPGDCANCGNKSSETWLQWRPRKLSFGDTAKFSFHVIPPRDLKEGKLKVWAFVPGQTEPMYYSESDFNCHDIHRFAKFVKCPFYKNKPVNVKNFEQYIAPSSAFPTGEFFIRLKLFTTTGEELLCIYGHVIVLDD